MCTYVCTYIHACLRARKCRALRAFYRYEFDSNCSERLRVNTHTVALLVSAIIQQRVDACLCAITCARDREKNVLRRSLMMLLLLLLQLLSIVVD